MPDKDDLGNGTPDNLGNGTPSTNPTTFPAEDDILDSNGHLIDQQPAYDRLLNAEVQLQHNGKPAIGQVTRHAVGPDSGTFGQYDDNPFLNSIVFDVTFPDGQNKAYTANVIAQNILDRVDGDGFSTMLFEGIVGHWTMDKAIPINNKWVTTRSGQRRLWRTTKGWQLRVLWDDNSSMWMDLCHLMESNPVDMAEYAVSQGIDCQPAFAWWVLFTLRKRDLILSAVKTQVQKTSYKYSVVIPRSVEHALEIDQSNGNT